MDVVRYPTTNPWVGIMTCPKCQHAVPAWKASGMSECWPHFYCDRCSNAIYRKGDQRIACTERSGAIVERIAATLPHCPCGGRFVPAANPKCPLCRTEFTHQDDAVRRLTDPHVIVLNGACFFSDERPPYRVEIG